jgi:hypothetical protein
MLSLVRSGPESLVLLAKEKIFEIRRHLALWGSRVLLTPEQALRIYGNNRRLIFFAPVSDLISEEEEEFETYVSENTIDHMLCAMINSRLISGIQEVRLLPGYITMRLLGNVEKGIEAVHRDLGGQIINRDPMYRSDIPSTSTVIYFTEKALNKPVSDEDLHKKALLIHDRSKGALLQYLTIKGIEYLGDALGTSDWNDVEIKIYDANGFFDLHRQRLWTATQGLQIGFVLEERWGKDQAIALKSVPIYMVKIFTPMNVREIKKIALGLEYDERGQRFADFDVFFKERKVGAYQELEDHPGLTRNAIGMLYRNEMIKNLDSDSRNKLLELEEEIKEKNSKKITN